MRPVFLILFLLVVSACTQQKVVSEQELKAYVLDTKNGLRKETEKNDVTIEVLYRPTELVLAQQLDGVTDQNERRKTIANFDSLSYFVLKLSRKGQEIENAYVSDNEKFVHVINYLSSSIGKNIYLVTERDTIHALDAVYARMFGASTATSVMIVFDEKLRARSGDIKFCLNDTELGLGQNEFEFDLSDIKKAPTLNLN
jgi:hypothetical protein